jgi:hydrogenase maturation protease
MTRVAVIGIGQSFRGDDAVGLEAVRQWGEKFPETAHRFEVRVEASELPGLSLLDLLEDVDSAILVDAVQSSAEPGTIHRLSENELATFTSDSKSAHGWGVAETLKVRHLISDNLSPTIRLIGIEIEQTDLGADLSEAVKKKIPNVCEAIQQEVESALA